MTEREILKGAFVAMLLGAIAFASPAVAAKGGNGHGQGHGNPHDAAVGVATDDNNDKDNHHGKHKAAIEEHDRVVLRNYISSQHEKWCPPGLAKKHNGCNPPGQLKYRVGTHLPRTVRYEVVPRNIVEDLGPLPPGDVYVRTGGDIYLMNKRDRTILDAVTLLGDLQ